MSGYDLSDLEVWKDDLSRLHELKNFNLANCPWISPGASTILQDTSHYNVEGDYFVATMRELDGIETQRSYNDLFRRARASVGSCPAWAAVAYQLQQSEKVFRPWADRIPILMDPVGGKILVVFSTGLHRVKAVSVEDEFFGADVPFLMRGSYGSKRSFEKLRAEIRARKAAELEEPLVVSDSWESEFLAFFEEGRMPGRVLTGKAKDEYLDRIQDFAHRKKRRGYVG